MTYPRPKIIDFGIAKAIGDPFNHSVQLTVAGQMMGTPEYMSPEQLGDGQTDSDTRSDIYSLGIILYELLTNTTPFRSANRSNAGLWETLRCVREKDAVPPSHVWKSQSISRDQFGDIRSGLPFRREIDWIVLKAIAKRPEKRYQSAAELANDVERYLEDLPIQAKPTTRLDDWARFVRRSPILAGLSFSVGILASLLLFGAVFAAFRLEHARNAVAEELKIRISAQLSAQRRLFESLLVQADATLHSGSIGQRLESLDTLTDALELRDQLRLSDEDLARVRNRIIAAVLRTDFRRLCALPLDLNDAYAPVDPASSSYVEIDGEWLQWRSIRDGELLQRAKVLPRSSILQWSANGKMILGRDLLGRCFLWKTDRSRTNEIRMLAMKPSAIMVTSSGDRIVWADADGQVKIAPVENTDEWESLAKLPDINGLAMNSDDELVAAFHVHEKLITFLDVESKAIIGEIVVPVQPMQAAWSLDRRFFAVAGSDYQIYLFDFATKQLVSVIEAHQNAITNLSFVGSSDRLITTSWDGSVRVWDIPTGKEVLHASGDVRWMSSDGHYILMIVEDEMELFAYEQASELLVLHPSFRREQGVRPQGWICGLSFHSAGAMLAACGPSGVTFWDPMLGTQIATLPIGNTVDCRFIESDDAFITVSEGGILRWPIQREFSSDKSQWVIDAPTVLRSAIGDHEWHVAVSPSSRRIAYVSEKDEPIVLQTNDQISKHLGRHFGVRYLSFSPKGESLAPGTFGGQDIRVVDVETGNLLWTYRCDEAARPVFNPDENTIAIAHRGAIRVFSAVDWTLKKEMKVDASRTLPYLTCASNGKAYWVSTSNSQRISLISAADLESICELESGNTSAIIAMDCLEAKGLLAVSRQDNSVEIYDLRRVMEHLQRESIDWPSSSTARYMDALPRSNDKAQGMEPNAIRLRVSPKATQAVEMRFSTN
ncbi:MAG: protein kinase [Pirellulales bacterium]